MVQLSSDPSSHPRLPPEVGLDTSARDVTDNNAFSTSQTDASLGNMTNPAMDGPCAQLMLNSVPLQLFLARPHTGEVLWTNERFDAYRGYVCRAQPHIHPQNPQCQPTAPPQHNEPRQTSPQSQQSASPSPSARSHEQLSKQPSWDRISSSALPLAQQKPVISDPFTNVHEDDLDIILAAWKDCLKNGKPCATTCRIRSSGSPPSYRHFLFRVDPLLSNNDDLLFWIGSFLDIHEQRLREDEARIERERLRADAKYRAFTNSIPQIVFEAAEYHGLISVNDRWHVFSGQTVENASNLGFTSIVHPDDLHQALYSLSPQDNEEEQCHSATTSDKLHSVSSRGITSLLRDLMDAHLAKCEQDEGGRPFFTIEVRLRSLSGDYRWHLVRLIKAEEDCHDDIGALWYGTCTDINDHKVLVQSFDSAMEKLNLQMESRTKFFSNMSHEIRTPLNGILGTIPFLLDTQLDNEQRRMLDTIHNSSLNLRELVDNILDVSKVEAGKMKLIEQWFHLRSVLEDVMDTVGSRAIDRGLELNYCVDEDVPAMIVGDRFRIRQILINLVGNAIKFTSQGEICMTCSLYHPPPSSTVPPVKDHELFVNFDIIDTGTGFSPQEAKTMMERFSQNNGPLNSQHGGSGLGLFLSKQLVEYHGGQLTPSSEGQGAKFSFYVRASTPPTPSASAGDVVSIEKASDKRNRFRPMSPSEVRERVTQSGNPVEIIHEKKQPQPPQPPQQIQMAKGSEACNVPASQDKGLNEVPNTTAGSTVSTSAASTVASASTSTDPSKPAVPEETRKITEKTTESHTHSSATEPSLVSTPAATVAPTAVSTTTGTDFSKTVVSGEAFEVTENTTGSRAQSSAMAGGAVTASTSTENTQPVPSVVRGSPDHTSSTHPPSEEKKEEPSLHSTESVEPTYTVKSTTDLQYPSPVHPPSSQNPSTQSALPILQHPSHSTDSTPKPSSPPEKKSQAVPPQALSAPSHEDFRILIICPARFARKALIEHVKQVIPFDVSSYVNAVAEVDDWKYMLETHQSTNQHGKYTHLIISLQETGEMIDVVQTLIGIHRNIPAPYLVVISDLYRRRELKPHLERLSNIGRPNMVIAKPVKPSSFSHFFDPDNKRDLSKDRNQDVMRAVNDNFRAVSKIVKEVIGDKGYRILLVEDDPTNLVVCYILPSDSMFFSSSLFFFFFC